MFSPTFLNVLLFFGTVGVFFLGMFWGRLTLEQPTTPQALRALLTRVARNRGQTVAAFLKDAQELVDGKPTPTKKHAKVGHIQASLIEDIERRSS